MFLNKGLKIMIKTKNRILYRKNRILCNTTDIFVDIKNIQDTVVRQKKLIKLYV